MSVKHYPMYKRDQFKPVENSGKTASLKNLAEGHRWIMWTLGIKPSTFGPGAKHPVYCPAPRIMDTLHTLKLNLLSGPSHFRCVGLKLMKPGTDSTDSECGEHGPHTGLVAGGVIAVLLVMALIITPLLRGRKEVNYYYY